MSAPNGMLSMSLDQIIQQRQKDHKSSKPAKKLTPVKAASQHNNKKAGGKFNRNLKNVSHTTDDSEAVQISRPLKVITIERPKVVNPTSSVFSRLGNAGTYVLFKNLKRSVEEADITELCNVIGEVKDVKLIRDFQGVGSAKVCFDSSKTANECVKKYNGVTLDGQEMTVVLDRAANVTVSRQSENATKKQQHVSESSNVRSGLFGTALAEDPDTSHRKVNVKFIDKPSKGKAGNNVHRKIEVSNNSNSAHKKKNGNKKGRESVTDQDLDQDLDTYMSSR